MRAQGKWPSGAEGKRDRAYGRKASWRRRWFRAQARPCIFCVNHITHVTGGAGKQQRTPESAGKRKRGIDMLEDTMMQAGSQLLHRRPKGGAQRLARCMFVTLSLCLGELG